MIAVRLYSAASRAQATPVVVASAVPAVVHQLPAADRLHKRLNLVSLLGPCQASAAFLPVVCQP